MNSRDPIRKPGLLWIYAPGLARWLAQPNFLKANALVFVLVGVFATCVIALILLEGSLALRVVAEIITAVLVATTVGLFYELVARRSMTDETIGVVREVIAEEVSALHLDQVGAQTGLIGFWPSRQFFHQDAVDHLRSAEKIRTLVIHGTRVWSNREVERAVLDRPGLSFRALLLDPSSDHIRARVEEHPSVYDEKVMRGQIVAGLRLLESWRKRSGGTMQLKTYDHPPSFWLVFIDDVLYLSGYDKNRVSQDSAVFKFDDRRQSMFHVFEGYFERLWLSGEEVPAVDEGKL